MIDTAARPLSCWSQLSFTQSCQKVPLGEIHPLKFQGHPPFLFFQWQPLHIDITGSRYQTFSRCLHVDLLSEMCVTKSSMDAYKLKLNSLHLPALYLGLLTWRHSGFWLVWYYTFTFWWFSVYVLWCLLIFRQSWRSDRLWHRIVCGCGSLFSEGLLKSRVL